MWFDLSYGGLTCTVDDVANWDYPTIYRAIKRMEVQKDFENRTYAEAKAAAKSGKG